MFKKKKKKKKKKGNPDPQNNPKTKAIEIFN